MVKKKIKNLNKIAVEFDKLYDFFDDETVDQYNQYQSNKNKFNVVDYDALERGEVPTVEIEDDEEYLVDNYEDEEIQEEIEDRQFEEKMKEPYTPPSVGKDVPSFGNEEQAINWAIQNKKVLKIDYTTKKGINIRRIIEPHLIYTAKNGSRIVVSYDRSVRDIRAFILNKIMNYSFTGKEFRERMKVIPNKEKKMNNNIENTLNKIESELKEKGFEKSAAIIKNAINVLKETKEAQYVGVQGYWIRNRRCWDNCYRHKRTTEPNKAAQEVWSDCWDEYLKSVNNPESGWEKYASIDKNMFDKKENIEQNKKFAEKIKSKIKEGKKIPEAVYGTFEEEQENNKNKVLEQVKNLTDLAVSFNDNGFKEIGVKIANVSNDILKEAGFWDSLGDITRGLFSPKETLKDWMSRKQQLVKRLKTLSQKALNLSKRLRQQLKYKKVQSSDKKIKEAQSTIGTPTAPVATPTPTPASPSPPPTAPASTVKQTPAQQDYRVNYIREAQNLAGEINEFISWMGEKVPQDNPRVANIVQTALYNLTDAANKINDATLNPQGVSILSLLSAVDNVAKAANTAMFSIYNEQGNTSPKSDSITPAVPSGTKEQIVDENKNNIDDRSERQDDLIKRLISSIPQDKLEYVKNLVDQRLGQNI